jgi:hypothetical protein
MTHFTPASCSKLLALCSLLLLVPRAGLASEAVAPEDTPFQRTELPGSVHLLELPMNRGPEWRPYLSGEPDSALPRMLLGATLGAIVGGMTSLLLAGAFDAAWAYSVCIPAGAIGGALLGYYGGSDDGSASSRVAAMPRAQPLPAVARGGVALRLGGRF